MERPKQQALMFLLGAVLVGGALGFTADRMIGHEHAGVVTVVESRERFYDALTLSEKQQAAFDSILDDRHRQFQAVLAPLRPQLDSIKENARAQMRRVLDPEQQRQFERFLAQSDSNGNKSR